MVLLSPSLRIYEQLWLGHEFTLTRLKKCGPGGLCVQVSEERAGIARSAIKFNTKLVSGVLTCRGREIWEQSVRVLFLFLFLLIRCERREIN